MTSCGRGWAGVQGRCFRVLRKEATKPKTIAKAALVAAGVGTGLKLRSQFRALSPAQQTASVLGIGIVAGAGGTAFLNHKLSKRSERISQLQKKTRKLKRTLKRSERLRNFTEKNWW